MKLSAIILSRTASEALFEMTCKCISTLVDSEKNIATEVIVIESNKQYAESGFRYPEFVKVIIPEAEFNFHKFLNIGIKASSGNYIALCNNDLVFHENWFTEMLKVANENPKILSFSPIGNLSEKKEKKYEIGYKVMTHIKGWCLVAKKEVFKKTGLLDESFDFFYADNDYAMMLKSKNIPHALVYNSRVTHLEKKKTAQNSTLDQAVIDKYKIPKYLSQDKYRFVFFSERNLSGFLKFHNKWGNPDFLYRKNKLADIFKSYGLGFLIPFFFKIRFR